MACQNVCGKCYQLVNNCCCNNQSTSCAPSGVVVAVPLSVDPCTPCDPCAETEEEEDEVETTCLYPAFVTSTNAFNIPACNETTILEVADACRFTKGTRLFSYLGIVLDVELVGDGTLTVINNCVVACEGLELLAPGTLVPAGTTFAIGIPSCGTSSGGAPSVAPFLDSDFVVPEPGLGDASCVTVKVTNVNTLIEGDLELIAGRTFRLLAIIDATTIRICNDGGGGTPGELVESDEDDDGVPDHQVIRVSGQNPCTSDEVSEVDRLVGCNGSDVQVGLVGSAERQIPIWDNTLFKWYPGNVEGAVFCPNTVDSVEIDPGAPVDQEYVFEVASTTSIQADLDNTDPNPVFVTIGDFPFCITSVVDATHFRGIPNFEVVEVTEIPAGSAVCIEDCCLQCHVAVETCADFGSEEDDALELVLYGSGSVVLTCVPGQNVFSLPSSLEAGDLWGYEEAASQLWAIQYDNSGAGCNCTKFCEILSNYEMCLDVPASVKGNWELRILKTAPLFNSKQSAAAPFVPSTTLVGEGKYVSSTQPRDQFFCGQFGDRIEITDPSNHIWKGHARFIAFNSTGGNLNVTVQIGWRAWIKVMNHVIPSKYSKF